jgi:plastocyanin domain-containing protein
MDTYEIGVVTGGALSVALVLWFFFGSRKKVAATVKAGGAQEVDIVVKGGYSPDLIVAEKGRPLRLNFYRDETSSCSERVVFGDFGLVKSLPAFKQTTVEFTPDKAGEFTFTCGMNMLRGKLIVEAK